MKNIIYSLIIFVIALVIGELVLRSIYDLPDPYENLRSKSYSTGAVIRLQNTRNSPVTFVFNPNELFPKEEKNIVNIHINNQGFRHHDDIDLSKTEHRIFAIGGSTTQGYDYHYDKTWCQVLEKNLEKAYQRPVNVYNGGTAGAAMFDHIALLQNRVIHLKPDMVILFAGINDLNVLVGDDNIYRYDDIYEQNEMISWYKLGLARLTLYKLYVNSKQRLKGNESIHVNRKSVEEDHIFQTGVPVQFADHQSPPFETEALPLAKNPDLNFDYYKKMVLSFIGTCKANGIPLVVMTQPTTWQSKDEILRKYHWMHKNKENKFSKDFMQESMDKMNRDVQEICIKEGVPCFHVENEIPANGEFFYDDCHFTPKGSIFIGNAISQFIINNNLVKIK